MHVRYGTGVLLLRSEEESDSVAAAITAVVVVVTIDAIFVVLGAVDTQLQGFGEAASSSFSWR